MTRADADGRSRSTAIYFLLARGERSDWHRIDAVEIWHYYAGAALTLRIADEGGQRTRHARPRSCGRRTAAGDRAGRTPGRQRRAPATGRWSAAPWRRDSSSRSSNWRRRVGSRFEGRVERSDPISCSRGE